MKKVSSKIIKKEFFRKSFIFKYAAISLGAIILSFPITAATYSEEVNKGLSDSLIRLHVVANSDSDEDQELKRDVRDVVIVYMEDLLKNSKDIDETKRLINMNLKDIEKLASQEVARQNKDYNVDVSLGTYPFPTKLYGDIALPAGTYQALKVDIGKSEGANWWCVLFPPLCFVDASHGTIPQEVKNDLKEVLSEDQYKIITATDEDDDLPIKVKFRVVEFLQASRQRFSGLLSYWNE